LRKTGRTKPGGERVIEKSVLVHEVGKRNTVSLDESQAEDAEKVQGSTMLRCDWQRQLRGAEWTISRMACQETSSDNAHFELPIDLNNWRRIEFRVLFQEKKPRRWISSKFR
jgi:hypothetical protein